MAEIQERAMTEPVERLDEDNAAADGTGTEALEETTGAVGALVGMLTGGFVIAAAAGFVVGFVAGVAVSRLAAPTPPPRWQIWR